MEAEKRGKEMGATKVTLDEVEDTDALLDNRTWVRIEVQLHMPKPEGGTRKTEKTVKCRLQNSAITDFEWR